MIDCALEVSGLPCRRDDSPAVQYSAAMGVQQIVGGQLVDRSPVQVVYSNEPSHNAII